MTDKIIPFPKSHSSSEARRGSNPLGSERECGGRWDPNLGQVERKRTSQSNSGNLNDGVEDQR